MSGKQLTLQQAAEWAEGTCVGDKGNPAGISLAGWAIDSRLVKAGDVFVAIKGAKTDGHSHVAGAVAAGAKALLLSTPVDTTVPYILVDDTVKALGQIAKKWAAQFQMATVAVTGSVGKTTTKSLIANIMTVHHSTLVTPGNANSEFSLPLLLLKLNESHDSIVLEMGACKAGDIAYLCDLAPPHIALVTCAVAVHLASFGSLDTIAHTKGEIYKALREDGTAVINADDAYAPLWKDFAKGKNIITFGMQNAADVYASDIEELGLLGSRFVLHVPGRASIAVKLPFPGRHNIQNALAAAAVAHAAGVSLETMKQGLETAQNAGGRLQVKQLGSLQVIDDSYNANPTSMRAAIDVLANLPGEKVLITGDMLELGPTEKAAHFDLGVYAKSKGLKHLFSYGPLSFETVRGFGEGARHFESHDALAEALHPTLAHPATVLVKGSRSMGMEKVIERLRNKL